MQQGDGFIVVRENVALSYKDNPLFDYEGITTHGDVTLKSVTLTDLGVLTLLALVEYIGDGDNWHITGNTLLNDEQRGEVKALADEIAGSLINAATV